MDILANKRINVLSKNVADKIAAGEIVDRPLSIVKELVENAIDAGSTSIIIEIKNGGKSYIRVTDNGCGIEKDDIELAFKRHATSKIKDASDLNSITSLGFRGEALASIAAVSRTELITKTTHEKSGIRIKIEGGEISEKVDTGCPEGTTVIIEDLFYNTPARFKFMKPDATESTLIIDFISKMALAYSNIKIRLINNGNILFSTPGKGDIYTNILTIYSKETGDKLIHFKEFEENIALEGFVSSPSQSKTNRKSQIFFVNGRYINSNVIENAVTLSYAEKLFEGRYPIVYLFLNVATDKIDVNIHPNKKEVRFDDEANIKDFIISSIRKNLNTKEGISDIKKENIFKLKADEVTNAKNNDIETIKFNEEQVNIKKLLSNDTQDAEQRQPMVMEDGPKYNFSNNSLLNNNFVNDKLENEPIINKSYIENTTIKEKKSFKIEDITITGSIFSTYITGTDEDSFYLIDQHAAHERIFYEQFLEQYHNQEKMKQSILTPFVINVSYAVKNISDKWLDFLGNIGFEIEEFGPKAYIIKAVPMFMSLVEASDFVEFILDNILEDSILENQNKLEKIISNACKKAVKAHDLLDKREIDQLIYDLSKTKNPYSCPHGRPTIIKLSKYEIEKMFKRV